MYSNLFNELFDLFLDLQLEITPSASIEVGAYWAEFSKKMKKNIPNIKSWAFEANPYNYDLVSSSFENIDINYLHLAVSDYVGSIEFNIQKNLSSGEQISKNVGNNSILERNNDVTFYDKIQIPCVTLDEYFINSKILNKQDSLSMWIDVEGASQQVLYGSTKCLKQTDSIFIEVEDIQHWKNQWLANDIDEFFLDKDFVQVARDYEYDQQHNVIYLKKHLLQNNKIKLILDNWNYNNKKEI